ncbi:RF-1 domain-containing protein [Hypoxylon argillaceum]|nr:RF-1 domain-containing protein [Hypoxylon argillaceum]
MTTSKFLFPRLAHAYEAVIRNNYPTLKNPLLLRNHIWKGISSLNRGLTAPRLFTTTNSPPLLKSNNNLPPRPALPSEDELEESFLKGSGPGGQKINKTNSAVQLKHIPTGLVVKCQATRSRSQNRTIARRLLADKLDDMALGDQSRSSIVGEFKRKKKASSAKKSRRKYRKLDEENGAATGEVLEGENSEDISNELPDEGNESDRTTVDKVAPDIRQQDAKI